MTDIQNNKGLGRIYIEDPKDNLFPMMSFLSPIPSKRVFRYWDANGWWGNQGNTPQCVGYGGTHWLEDGPITHKNVAPPLINPTFLYREAQKIDEWADTPHDGTSVRAMFKFLQSIGYVGTYRWGRTLQELVQMLLEVGPCVLGTNWYTRMFDPDKGRIKVEGMIEGGHCFVANGVNTKTRLIRIKNSWGQEWGLKGHATISFDDMERLIQEDGEICFAEEVPEIRLTNLHMIDAIIDKKIE